MDQAFAGNGAATVAGTITVAASAGGAGTAATPLGVLLRWLGLCALAGLVGCLAVAGPVLGRVRAAPAPDAPSETKEAVAVAVKPALIKSLLERESLLGSISGKCDLRQAYEARKVLNAKALRLFVTPKLLPLPLPKLLLLAISTRLSSEEGNQKNAQQTQNTQERYAERTYSKFVHHYSN